jgi:signal transduction histidine kinase
VIDAIPEAVLLTGPDDVVRLANPSAERLFADRPVRDRADLLSRFETITPADGRGAERSVVRPRNQPNRWFAIEDHRIQSTESTSPPVIGPPSVEAGGSVIVLRDLSELPSTAPQREAFLSIVSHELRTPITTIYAGSAVLAREAALSPDAARRLAADISGEAARLYDVVEDLIALARFERRILDPAAEPVLLQRVVEGVLRVVASRAPTTSFSRSDQTHPPPVEGDAGYIDQAARNLALAAARASVAGSPVFIALGYDPQPGEVSLRVVDAGRALTAEELARAFELPGSDAVGRSSTAGIGPFVARHLIESMGGRVWVANQPDGVEFGFALRAIGRN